LISTCHWKIDLMGMLMSKFVSMDAEKLTTNEECNIGCSDWIYRYICRVYIYLINAKVLSLLQSKLVLKMRKSFDIYGYIIDLFSLWVSSQVSLSVKRTAPYDLSFLIRKAEIRIIKEFKLSIWILQNNI